METELISMIRSDRAQSVLRFGTGSASSKTRWSMSFYRHPHPVSSCFRDKWKKRLTGLSTHLSPSSSIFALRSSSRGLRWTMLSRIVLLVRLNNLNNLRTP